MPHFSVSEALQKLNFSPEMLKVIQNRNDVWENFGKSNSHLLRAKLFKLFDSENMSQQARMAIFMLFSAIKNLKRVKEHLDNLPDEIKALKEIAEARVFMDKRLVQYTTQENMQKFAVVHLPTTMPGLDILLHAMMFEYDMSTLKEDIIGKMTFTQMNIDDDLQAENKYFQEQFWNNQVTTSNNPNQDAYRQNKGFNLKFYETSAADKYDFLNTDLTVFKPTSERDGMTQQDLERWYKKVKGVTEERVLTPPTTEAGTSSRSAGTMPTRR